MTTTSTPAFNAHFKTLIQHEMNRLQSLAIDINEHSIYPVALFDSARRQSAVLAYAKRRYAKRQKSTYHFEIMSLVKMAQLFIF